MRKIILSMLLLAGATTYAQVGINEENPKATLDIKAKSLNTEDNLEGLLIPRVSINKALQMGNNSDIEVSTMIYINDLSDYTASPADTKVADITENGFYFWNGTKWVRQTGQDGEEWVFESGKERIRLRRSGENDFKNNVFYTKEGRYINEESGKTFLSWPKDAIREDISTEKSNSFNIFQLKSKSIPSNINRRNTFAYMSKDVLDVEDEGIDKLGLNKNIANKAFITQTQPENTKVPKFMGGMFAYAIHRSSQDIESIIGASGDANVYDAGVTGSIVGLYGSTTMYTNSNINEAYGVRGFNSIGADTSPTINNASALLGYNFFRSGGSPVVTSVAALELYSLFETASSPSLYPKAKITNLYGINLSGMSGNYQESTVKNNYGIHIGDIANGTSVNYSIYTNAGDIRFGDLVNSTSALDSKNHRLVITDANGVLGASDAVVDDFRSLWENDPAQSLVKLKNKSDGTPRVSTSGATRNEVAITDEGKILAKAFIGYHGASIFPDYVFEKYYKGYSDIKADYNFHNLASVESFVKKNGHLPGYQSAKEIAKEGLIDISATQLTNIEKIEELYLHTIEQEKKIEAKDVKIEKLEAELKSQKEEINELRVLVNRLINK